MEYSNAFFQMVIREEGVFIKYFPPRNGGSILNFDELRTYLINRGIKIDPVKFSREIVAAQKPVLIGTETKKTYPEAEKMLLSVSDDGMIATCRFLPPSTGGRIMNKEDVMKELIFQGIRFGIDEEAVESYIRDKKYCTDYILAKGKPQIEGHDARIVYKFNTDRKAKPKERSDGSVDFYSLDIITKTVPGGILAEHIPAYEGEAGTDVRGKRLLPRPVLKKEFQYGKNTRVSEDGHYLISETGGHVLFEDGKISVSETYEVGGDVDVSTGNIEFDGNVEVKGNVSAGFSIRAGGDVIVDGTAEGAEIMAEGDIILKNGMRGMGKGKLRARGNIIARFLESADARANGYITADTILNSTVSAKEEIFVNSKKGYVNGGSVSSASLIRVKNAGSEMGTRTELSVGVDPELAASFREAELRLEEILKKMDSLGPLIELFGKKLKRGESLPEDKILQFQLMTAEYKDGMAEAEELQERIMTLSEEIGKGEGGKVEIADTAYPGVRIIVQDASLYIRTVTRNSRFTREGADVKVGPLI